MRLITNHLTVLPIPNQSSTRYYGQHRYKLNPKSSIEDMSGNVMLETPFWIGLLYRGDSSSPHRHKDKVAVRGLRLI